MSSVNKIVSGMTPKGTIFIRELGEKGQVLRKHVLKGEMQYDAKMSSKKSNKCSQVLITDWNKNGEQTLQLMPKKIGMVKGFILKALGADLKLGADGKYLVQREPISMEKQSNSDILFESYVKMVQEKTGFWDIAIKREMTILKCQLNVKKFFQKNSDEAIVHRSFPPSK